MTRSRVLLAAAIVVIVGATVAYVIRTSPQPVQVQIGSAAADAFAHGEVADPTARRAMFSPDGTTLAVLTSAGLGVGSGGRVKLLTPPGATVADAAWMPNAKSLLTIEGPAQADRVTVLDLAGAVQGTAHLDHPFVDGGEGLAVDGRGARAVAVAETRDVIGGRRHTDLVLIELQTGEVRPLVTTADADEGRPVFVDDHTVAFARTVGTGASVATAVVRLDLASGAATDVSPPGETARPVGRLPSGAIVYEASARGGPVTVWAAPPGGGARTRMGGAPAGAEVWSIDPSGHVAVATVHTTLPTGEQTDVLRSITLHPPPAG